MQNYLKDLPINERCAEMYFPLTFQCRNSVNAKEMYRRSSYEK